MLARTTGWAVGFPLRLRVAARGRFPLGGGNDEEEGRRSDGEGGGRDGVEGTGDGGGAARGVYGGAGAGGGVGALLLEEVAARCAGCGGRGRSGDVDLLIADHRVSMGDHDPMGR